MKRLFCALLFFPAIAAAARVTVFPSGPVHVGEWITVEIDLGVRSVDYHSPEVSVTNFQPEVVYRPPLMLPRWKEIQTKGKWDESSTLVFHGYPIAEGDIVFGPFHYKREDGRPFAAPAVRLHAGRDLADGLHPADALKALARAGRSEVVITTTLRKPRIYVGEEVVVEWSAIGDLDHASIGQQQENALTVPGVERIEMVHVGVQKPDVLDGRIVQKKLLDELHLFPRSPGLYSIPSLRYEGEDERLSGWNTRYVIEKLRFVRKTPPAVVEVLPRPEAARGPIGTFRLECTEASLNRYWPVVDATVIGSSELGGAAPALSSMPDETVITNANRPRLDQREVLNEWYFEAHAEKAQLPPIVFAYYDTTKEANVELRCNPPAVARQVASVAVPEPLEPPPVPMDPMIRNVLDIAGIALVIASSIFLVRTIRG